MYTSEDIHIIHMYLILLYIYIVEESSFESGYRE